jgi:ABC-type uncharacterized transport system auxiliary subunit
VSGPLGRKEPNLPMRHTSLAAAIVLLAGFYTGCGAARPVKYYTLSAPPAPAVNPNAPFPIDLVVGRLDAAEMYRLDRIAYGSGRVELGLYENDRWANPPVDMVQDMLVSALRATGQYRSVNRVSSLVRGNYVVRGHLYSLYEVDEPALVGRFSVEIDLYDPKARSILWSDSYTHDEPVGSKTVAAVVEALDSNVTQGLHQLATELGQYFAAHPVAASSSSSD